MSMAWKTRLTQAAAILVAAMIFTIDCVANFDVSISILYIGALALVAWHGSERQIFRAALACIALAILSWLVVHGDDTNLASGLRLVFSSTAIGVTAALLISRKHLNAVRQELERSRGEVQLFADSVPNLLWRTDRFARVEFFNRRFDEITGRDGKEAVASSSYFNVIHPDDLPAYIERVNSAVGLEGPLKAQMRIRYADGEYRWMQILARPVRDPQNGEIVNWYGGATDIHDEVLAREEAQQLRTALEESRAELQNFTDSVPQILWRTNDRRELDFLNRRYAEVTGDSLEDAIGLQSWALRYHPKDLVRLRRAMDAGQASGDGVKINIRIRNAAGDYRWMSVEGRPVTVPTPDGDRLYWYGGNTDVHEQVLAQQEMEGLRAELEESRAELLNFMDSVHYILWRASPAAEVDFYNRRYREVIGRDPQETMGNQSWLDDFHPDDRGWYMAEVERSFGSGEDLSAICRLMTADGTYRWMHVVGRPVRDAQGNVLRYYGGASDVHAEVVAREELQRTRAQLETARAEVELFANSVPYILWRSNAAGEVQYFNQRWTEITGLDREEALVDQRYLEMVHPDDLPDLGERIAHAVATNGISDTHVRVRQADGGYRWMHLYDHAVTSPATGRIERFGGAGDIQLAMDMQAEVRELNETLEQRVVQRTDELLRTEARYAGLFEVSNMTFAEMDFRATEPLLDKLREDGVTDLASYLNAHPDEFAHMLSLIRTTRVNEALARLMGYEDVADLVANPPVQNADTAAEVLLRQLEMYYYGVDHIDGRTVLTGKDNVRVPVYFTVNRLAEGLHLSSHVNLSEQERISELREAAQEELARANRIATVGAFSASIAHELNQPIASMVMDVQTGLRFLTRDEPDTVAAERILQRLSRTAQRVAGIVQHTRDSLVAGQRETRPIDLCKMASETGELLERELRRAKVHFELDCAEGVPDVSGDPVQLQQVMVNLINNAAEAMRDQPGERHIRVTIGQVDGIAEVSVADSGPGIAEENIDRLFQPFFTTKASGMGMGLQICRSTIEAMGGDLTVRNQPEGGAVFAFRLPIVTA